MYIIQAFWGVPNGIYYVFLRHVSNERNCLIFDCVVRAKVNKAKCSTTEAVTGALHPNPLINIVIVISE